jgi:hypothetical protein
VALGSGAIKAGVVQANDECRQEKGIQGFGIQPSIPDEKASVDCCDATSNQCDMFAKKICCEEVDQHTGP